MRACVQAGACAIHRVTFAPVKHLPEVQKRLAAIKSIRERRAEEDTGHWWQVAAQDEHAWAAAADP